MDKFSKYLRATMAEMKQVKWPTQNQALVYTTLVVVISALLAVFIAIFDFFFGQVIDFIINNF